MLAALLTAFVIKVLFTRLNVIIAMFALAHSVSEKIRDGDTDLSRKSRSSHVT